VFDVTEEHIRETSLEHPINYSVTSKQDNAKWKQMVYNVGSQRIYIHIYVYVYGLIISAYLLMNNIFVNIFPSLSGTYVTNTVHADMIQLL
jgi:hypothetical protein